MSRLIFSLPLLVILGYVPVSWAQEAPATRPALLFREEWKRPPYTGKLNDVNMRVTPAAVTNANLELTLYGPDAAKVEVASHEGRLDLWNGLAESPVAITLRDKDHYVDLTGLARLRAITRTNTLHVLHPVVKFADGTLGVGSQVISTNSEFLETEVAFGKQRWFKLDPAKVVNMVEVKNPDLSKVDEVGLVDLMPGGGHGMAGSVNISVVELYAKPVPRSASKALPK